jgi:hypothetical protein
MLPQNSLPLLLVVGFIGATPLRSSPGCGDALVGVPGLAFVRPAKLATPIAVAVSHTMAAQGRAGR